jgi:hypothetical protein
MQREKVYRRVGAQAVPAPVRRARAGRTRRGIGVAGHFESRVRGDDEGEGVPVVVVVGVVVHRARALARARERSEEGVPPLAGADGDEEAFEQDEAVGVEALEDAEGVGCGVGGGAFERGGELGVEGGEEGEEEGKEGREWL